MDRNEEIIKIATELFSEKGYDNTSTRELAKASELSVAGLYYFFQNKEEILFTILNTSLSKYLESLRSTIEADVNPKTNIEKIIECVVRHILENKKEITLLVKESKRLSPEQLVIIRSKEREVFDLIRNEMIRLNDKGCLKDFNLSFLTFAIIGIVNYTKNWYDSKSGLSIEELIAEIKELFFKGVLK